MQAPSNPGPRPGRPEAARAVWRWDDITAPSSGGTLRRAGVVRGVVGLLIGTAIFLWWHFVLSIVVFSLAGFTLIAALLSPGGLYRRLHRATEALGQWIGLAMGWLLLPLFFFLLLTPLALLMRLRHRDRLQTRRDPAASSYWTSREHQPKRDRDFYERQF